MQDTEQLKIYEEIQENLYRRYRLKKRTNLCISLAIALLGITSFVYGLGLESIRTILRWLTVDGTLFTTSGAILCITVNLVEVLKNTEMTRLSAYYLRLSSAMAESVIFIVVLFSQLPIFPEHLPIFDRYDSFVMHVLVPLLGIVYRTNFFSSYVNPLGLVLTERWHWLAYLAIRLGIASALIALLLLATGRGRRHGAD